MTYDPMIILIMWAAPVLICYALVQYFGGGGR